MNLKYIPWLIKEIFSAGFMVVRRVLSPHPGFSPIVVRYPLRVTSEWDIFWFSTSITATPSTMSIGLREPAVEGEPRILLVQDVFGSDPSATVRGLAEMEERLNPSVAKLDYGVPGQGSVDVLPDEYYEPTRRN